MHTLNRREDDLMNSLIAECKTKTAEDIVGKNGLLQMFMKKVLQSVLDSELEEHLGYKKHGIDGKGSGNSRNGLMKKTLRGEFGELELETPRDRNGSFEPQIVKKHQTRFHLFDDKIIALYAKGMTTRDIHETLKELYDVEVSPSLIARVTDGLLEATKAWQERILETVYPVVYLDCIYVKIKQDGTVINKAVYLALGINMEGQKELLGMWISEHEGAKFWLGVLTELKNRGLQDMFIACVDGLKGFPDAIRAVFPQTRIQLCIVHQVRNSMKCVIAKDMKAVASDLKEIYTAATLDAGEQALNEFEEQWDAKYPSISRSWRNNWENLISIYDYPADIRKAIYTTNAIESLNMVIRKAIRNRRIFPCDSSAFKVILLAIQAASKRWTMPIRNWKLALNHFHIEFGERCPV